MIRAAITFFVLAMIAALFGANGIAGLSFEAGKLLLVVFLVLALLSAALGAAIGRKGLIR